MLSFEKEKLIFCNTASGAGVSGSEAEHNRKCHAFIPICIRVSKLRNKAEALPAKIQLVQYPC